MAQGLYETIHLLSASIILLAILMKDYGWGSEGGGGPGQKSFFTKQSHTLSLSVYLCGSTAMCAVAHLPWTNKRGTLQSQTVLASHYIKTFSVASISHRLWSIAAIRTAYCPGRWIGAVRRRKGQCWDKHQRYSQNALRLPHTRTLFCPLTPPVSPNWGWSQTLFEHWTEKLPTINHKFLQVTPQTDYEIEQISIQSRVLVRGRHRRSESYSTVRVLKELLLPDYIRSRGSMWWWV